MPNELKPYKELAIEILEEFTNCFSEADEDALARMVRDSGFYKQSRGEWVWGKLGGREARICSLCGAGFTGENAEWIAEEHTFCPKCGAKMKGDKDEQAD